MVLDLPEEYKEIIYSGDVNYDCRLYINNYLVPIEQISTIKISSPIIDTTQDTGSIFHIGTFISNSIEIKFRNLNEINLLNNPTIYLEIGVLINGEYTYIPIGYFLIDELAENYQTTCTITAMDYAIKFKPQLDISQFLDEEGKIYASDLFEAICGFYGVEIGTYPNVNNDKIIYSYDSELSGKEYIMYLAELFGGNAKIGRDGKCNIIPLQNYTTEEIDALTSKKFEVGDKYELTRVCYDNGVQKLQAGGNVISVDELPIENIDINSYYYLTEDMKYYKYINIKEEGEEEEYIWEESTDVKNTLYLRNDNIFISQQYEVDQIYNSVVGFTIYNITCENRMDLSLDCFDIVKYVTDNGEYYTFYDNNLTFNGIAMGTVKVNLPMKTTEETTNIITATTSSKIRRIKTVLDEEANTLTTIVSQVEGNIKNITSIQESIDGITSSISQTNDDLTEQINNILATIEGTTQVITNNGGNNIFYYAKEFWSNDEVDDEGKLGEANLDELTEDNDIRQNSISGRGYTINNGLSVQKANVSNDDYVVSFKYKKLTELAYAYVDVNGVIEELTNDDWTEITIPLTIDTGTIEFRIYCDTDNSFKITDLMGNIGTEKAIWTQNPNETRTDTVTIGKGIEVHSSNNKTYTRIDADGTRIFNDETHQPVTTFTSTGVETVEIDANVGKIGGILIQSIDGQTWISSLL